MAQTEYRITIESYQAENGIRLIWDREADIKLSLDASEVTISANVDGLRSLARHLLTLAQPGPHRGAHLHFTAGESIDGSVDLIIERT